MGGLSPVSGGTATLAPGLVCDGASGAALAATACAAHRMLDTAVPELSAAVEAGTVPVSAAADAAKLGALAALGRGCEPGGAGVPPLL